MVINHITIIIKYYLDNYTNDLFYSRRAIFNSTYGKPKRPVRYRNVNCYGNEKRLADCAHHTLEFDSGSRYNIDSEVAGVDCHGKKKVINCPYCTTVQVVINI